MKIITAITLITALLSSFSLAKSSQHSYLVFEPDGISDEPQHVVFVTGDEEYRSEEWGPMLAKILSKKHGFRVTVLFAQNNDGTIDPNNNHNIPGMEVLDQADLLVLGTRWRQLPEAQMLPVLNYLNAGKPLIALRTATHAFNNEEAIGGYDWTNFGREVVGENWLNHHGEHKVQGGRSVVNPAQAKNPLLNGVEPFFTYSDIYGIEHLHNVEATVLLHGAVTESLDPHSPAVEGEQNSPMMPLAWIKPYAAPNGEAQGTCFATTAGAAVDFKDENLRRLVVNAAYHLLGLDVPPQADVTPIDRFEPSFYGFQDEDYFVNRGLKVSDFSLGRSGRSILTNQQLQWLQESKLASRANVDFANRDSIAIVGNGLAERMLHYGYFESEIYAYNAGKNVSVHNLARAGMTPVFRPHSSRDTQWLFPEASKLYPQLSEHSGVGTHPSPDEWLKHIAADKIIAFFGYNESFDGVDGIARYKNELRAYIKHTRAQHYNGRGEPELILVSPIAFQDLSADHALPDGVEENRNLALYTRAMAEVAKAEGVDFVDIYTPTKRWFVQSTEQLTVNGAHLNQRGYQRLAAELARQLMPADRQATTPEIVSLVREKNFHWFNHYQMPNGVHVDGRRFEPFGPDNYPAEKKKTWQLTRNREEEIWAVLNGKGYDRQAADAATVKLPDVETNAPERAEQKYLYGDDALARFNIAPGYAIELFVSEKDFPNMANPVQLTFDGKGRLWVSVMPSYPHYRPGDPVPDDKILIYEDTDGDGKADKETVFADKLHLPVGFELTAEGVYVSQAPNLLRLRDTDGDDRADVRDIILSGFDTHDTHHAISAFTRDQWGGLIFAEGVFLHTNVETAYGPVRAVNGGFYRFEPRSQKLQRLVQTHIPNPWGVAFDRWGQGFFLSTSNPDMHWMLPVELRTHYGQLTVGTESLIESDHRVRPTSGLIFIDSDHFPDEVQGDFILNNSIGFLGAKQHRLTDEGTGYTSQFVMDLYRSSDPNFRAVDLDFSPDGSLYLVDWHNQLIGHMQHNARDPLRDHAHGRIYRITYEGGALSEVSDLTAMSPDQLWQMLARVDWHQRQRIYRELRKFSAHDVAIARDKWLKALREDKQLSEHRQIEALWADNRNLDPQLIRQLLQADDFKVRAAAVEALRYHQSQFDDALALLNKAAQDDHPRVRLEAVVAATWMSDARALSIVEQAADLSVDDWARQAYTQAAAYWGGNVNLPSEDSSEQDHDLPPEVAAVWEKGREIYRREGFCSTCHQEDGKGLPAAQFPPLAQTEWVTGNAARLIDIALNGLTGPIDVNGRHYPGHVPMTQFKGMLNNEEMAAVLTYVRNAFGNSASAILPEQVEQVRRETADKTGFWLAPELEQKYAQ
ncbi:HEAT repeat domain-containing protein [Gilvimarinus sp. SDUM040013]|uniref:PVC-type heme-binding CxxCH protein n=1 Tax=Gilvimarinus gilvus TaxID=3058038 RepID=A0ABU4S0N9_9GAMM|nr:PVC-type heme-binding CxxCH protein [Gilvimarinus sp. SDUM040013]MDO3384593.1 HEAT repeat domain-containing protein [Gilvimarinus sp. SDUM040013]MDX6850071.1 PVC-type heme-binding CxxCH protein [Gilvimarinus sp. SDUM040013]